MNNMNHNDSIHCLVKECKFHCVNDDYCTLEKIDVVKHGAKADNIEATDCGSFQKS